VSAGTGVTPKAAPAAAHRRAVPKRVETPVQENRTSEERRSRLIESLKSEADTELPATAVAQGSKGYRYPRSRWSAPAQ